jgi:hypothetical protein
MRSLSFDWINSNPFEYFWINRKVNICFGPTHDGLAAQPTRRTPLFHRVTSSCAAWPVAASARIRPLPAARTTPSSVHHAYAVGSPAPLLPPPDAMDWTPPHFSLYFGARKPPRAPPLHPLCLCKKSPESSPAATFAPPLPFVPLTARICHREQWIWSYPCRPLPLSVSNTAGHFPLQFL